MKILFTPTIVAQELTDQHRACILEAAPGATIVAPGTPEAAVREAADTDIFLGNMTRPQFQAAPRLRYFHAISSGVDRHMYPEFIESDVTLTSEKGIVGTHLADHAFALLLCLTRGLPLIIREPTARHQMTLRRASWELTGLTMGVIGLGGTGIEVARRAVGFGMRVIAVDPEPVERPATVEAVWGLDRFHELLAQSDVVTICAPLTPVSREMFDRDAFAAMRRTAILINVTRGEIVEEAALLAALRAGEIAGAGLDVTPIEPLPDEHPLWHMPNVVITPHTAGASPLRVGRDIERFCRNLRHLQANEPLEGIIDKRKGY